MSSPWIGIALLALAGFLIGGVYSTWRSSRPLASLLGVAAGLAGAGGVLYLL